MSPDDPILMIVTVLNAFLAEEEKLLDHRKALTAILAERTDGYVRAVEQTTAHLGESLSSASAKRNVSVVFRAHRENGTL